MACRTRSYHNSQPWRWVVGGGELHLFITALVDCTARGHGQDPSRRCVPAAESDRVDVGRAIPVTDNRERWLDLGGDRARVLVISALDDARRDIRGCGEMCRQFYSRRSRAG